ncbi:MAG: SDR family oxidoreductase [Cupriavidus sp.]|nr:MAG: SDR family oxidoreductase [Cupriavidus sp.]
MSIVTLNGKVALVTGANSGIGRVTARELALNGYHVFLACRSTGRGQAVADEIASLSQGSAKVEVLALDLGDFDSVRQCADAFLKRELPLHLFIANAGIAGSKGRTASGFEMAFGICHMGHFLLTQLLLERIKASAPARIVVVASHAHRRPAGIDFPALRQDTKTFSGFPEYGVAKLANVLFAAELGRRLEGSGVTTYALHPGVVATNVWRAVPWPLGSLMKYFMISEEEGAATTLYCALAPEAAGQTGLYYEECQLREPAPLGRDAELAGRLWEESERWLQQVPA